MRRKESEEQERTSAIGSHKKATIAGIKTEGKILDQGSGARRRMAVNSWVCKSEIVDLHCRFRSFNLFLRLLHRHFFFPCQIDLIMNASITLMFQELQSLGHVATSATLVLLVYFFFLLFSFVNYIGLSKIYTYYQLSP